jgi:hypothetical protein
MNYLLTHIRIFPIYLTFNLSLAFKCIKMIVISLLLLSLLNANVKVMYKYGSLENFWKRFNKVQLDKAALDREKGLLMHENQQLRMLLKQYLDGISVNDEVISQVNPLFVVNYKSNVKAYVTFTLTFTLTPMPYHNSTFCCERFKIIYLVTSVTCDLQNECTADGRACEAPVNCHQPASHTVSAEESVEQAMMTLHLSELDL